ncbi:hypothetical protein Y032_0215g2370 [Ancylostoma ceylanicum]|nr:hypothetical protein Y032_0215g2370 [Ancylostoma ceylanicum]
MRLRLSNTTNHIPLIPVIAGYMELVGGKRRQRMTNNRSTTDVESCRTSSEVREHSNCGRISGSRCVLVGRSGFNVCAIFLTYSLLSHGRAYWMHTTSDL